MHATRSFWPSFFSRVAARLQWNARAIDFAPDARRLSVAGLLHARATA